MLVILSPAKTLDMSTVHFTKKYTICPFLNESRELISLLKLYSVSELQDMMGISQNLALLNHQRFEQWTEPTNPQLGKQALFAFDGDVYTALDAQTMKHEDILYSQDHLRILSGLYGLLRPLDIIAAYRLEMGTKLQNSKGENLYSFWGNKITEALQIAINEQSDDVLINLASNEYYKSVNILNIKATIISPEFKENKDGKYKIISFFAKKARGLMTRFIIENRISNPNDLKHFDLDGYFYNDALSTEFKPVFTR